MNQLIILTELAPFGSLENLLYKSKQVNIPLSVKIGMLYDIACGINYLHSKNVIIL